MGSSRNSHKKERSCQQIGIDLEPQIQLDANDDRLFARCRKCVVFVLVFSKAD